MNSAVKDDSLLQCLLALCRYHGSASPAEALSGGLPLVNGRLTPGLFERAAGRVGLVSRIVERAASDIEAELLPAILLLENDRACLLLEWDATSDTAKVIYPDLNEAAVDVPGKKLRRQGSRRRA